MSIIKKGNVSPLKDKQNSNQQINQHGSQSTNKPLSQVLRNIVKPPKTNNSPEYN